MYSSAKPLTGYQKILVGLLALLQFTVLLDFMVLAPLGNVLMKSLDIGPAQFSLVVSAYAFSAGGSGYWPPALPTASTVSACYCFFMPALRWARSAARWPIRTGSCCWSGWWPACLGRYRGHHFDDCDG